MSLIGTITDGDIRRCLLSSYTLESPLSDVLAARKQYSDTLSITAPLKSSRPELLEIMTQHGIRQLPIINETRQVVSLVTLEELILKQQPNCCALILAGGFGTRLRPLTSNIPKPMLPIGTTPVLEFIVRNLVTANITEIFIATHYLPERITQYFGDGAQWGAKIHYIQEENPLGTAGALSLLPGQEKNVLLINGDIFFTADLGEFFKFHVNSQAEITIGVKEYTIQLPYGVVELQNNSVSSISEKPSFTYQVNTGIYAVSPKILRSLTPGNHLLMTDLITQSLKEKRPVSAYHVPSVWIDIGEFDQYISANVTHDEALTLREKKGS